MDDTSTPASARRTMTRMDLEHWTDLDLAYLLAFGAHPDLRELHPPQVRKEVYSRTRNRNTAAPAGAGTPDEGLATTT